MKLSHVTILASCAALALSQPLDKRVVVFETVTEEVIETVAVTTTHYIRPGEHAPSPSVTPSFKKYRYKHSHTKKRSVTPKPSPSETFTPPVEPVVTPEVKPVIIPEAPPTVTPEVPPPVITPEAQSVAPPEVPPVVTPEVPPPVITPEVKPVAPPEDPPVITPEASSATPVQTPSAAPQEKYEYSYSFDNQVVPPPSATPKVETPPASTGGSGGGACGEVGGKCSGDLTFYDAGLGACGWYNDGNSEAVFALAVGMMGDQSNGNPFCGRSATITANGKSVVAKLVDKCMGCVGQSVDLSNYAIDQIMDRSVGRMHNVEWYFND